MYQSNTHQLLTCITYLLLTTLFALEGIFQLVLIYEILFSIPALSVLYGMLLSNGTAVLSFQA